MATIMLTIEVGYSTGMNGGKKEDTVEVEVEETATPEEVEAACEEAFTEWFIAEVDRWWSYTDGRERLT